MENENISNPIYEDGFDISTAELIIRTNKWVNLVTEKRIETMVELLPQKIISEKKTIADKTTDLGTTLFHATLSNFKNVTSFSNPMNYLRAAGSVIQGVNVKKKVERVEILEHASFYLGILELRGQGDSFAKTKFEELKSLYGANIEKFEIAKSKKFWQ